MGQVYPRLCEGLKIEISGLVYTLLFLARSLASLATWLYLNGRSVGLYAFR